jgi:signal transduction histidine kinase
MMDLAQIESGQALLKLVPIAVAPLVQASVSGLSPHAELKGQHISLFLPAELMVLADEQQVTRVVRNLVHNAIKFAPEGGIISIFAQAEDEEDVRICVSDNGPGISRDDQERIFERYKRDHAQQRGNRPGWRLPAISSRVMVAEFVKSVPTDASSVSLGMIPPVLTL